jgi:hypothetical protein
MNKQELINKIKGIAKAKYDKQLALASGEQFSSVGQYPQLKDILKELMTDEWGVFVTGVDWVAPKPTTFKISLGNGEFFFLTHTNKSWVAQIESKNFYLLNISERQDAMNAITRILKYGKPKPKTSTGAEGGETATPAEETPEELPA